MIGEFIFNNFWLIILPLAMTVAGLVLLYLKTEKARYGLALFIIVISFVFFGFEFRVELDERADAFCLDKGLESYGWTNGASTVRCYKTTNGSAEIITFEEIDGKMYRLSDSGESDE